jgi:hypothetical protein
VRALVLGFLGRPEEVRRRAEEYAQSEQDRLSRGAGALRMWGRLADTQRRRSALIYLTADGTITHEDLRDKLAELAESPARDLPYLLDKRRVVRDHETLPDERTPDNPGIYTLTPDRNRHLPEEEIARKEHEAEDERSERYRAMYNELGLRVVGHPDGTLEASWRLGRPCCVEAVTRVPIATLQSTSTRPDIP